MLDPVRQNVVLTGGAGDTIRTDDTWTWDGSNWTQQSPLTQVEALVFAAGAFDSDSQLVIVFGGFGMTSNQDLNQTWSWDGTIGCSLVWRSLPQPATVTGWPMIPATMKW